MVERAAKSVQFNDAVSKKHRNHDSAQHSAEYFSEASPFEFALDHKASCACGGSCPRCNAGSYIQPKLIVGPQDDAYEQEADRVAEQVMRTSDTGAAAGPIASAGPSVQRQCKTCEPEQETDSDLIQRYSTHGNDEAMVESAEGTIGHSALTSSGQPLNANTRDFFESRFNRDLSDVRLHTGSDATAYCQQLDAHAFTYRNHVWLGGGLIAIPSFVMAHELAHVIQQTQPPVRKNGVRDNGAAVPATQATARPSVQRLPFWVPISKKGSNMTGSELHKELLEAVEGKNNVESEAPVPNATRGEEGLGLQGFADLYRASSRVGVFFNPRQGLGPGDTSGSERYFKPAKPKKAGKAPKPVATAKGGIDHIADGPKNIEIGELKPASLTELTKGNTQLGHYEKGFEDAAELTNLWSDASTSKTKPKWTLNSVKRLPEKDVQIAAKHDPADSVTGADRSLALADIDENEPKKGQSEGQSKYSVQKVFTPKSYLGEEIKGKLYMEPFGQGIWMYYAHPTDLQKALDLPTFNRAYIGGLMTVANAVQDEVIGNLKRGPEQIKLLPIGRSRPADVPPPCSVAPVHIQRKVKKAKLKDHFDGKAFEKWSKRQTALGNEVRGKDKTKGTEKTFKKLEFLELASKAEDALDSKVKKKGSNFPNAADLKLKIETGTGKDTVTKNTGLDKVFGWLERWTSVPYKALGKFRQIFGSGFVTAVNKFSAIKEKISAKVQAFFKERATLKKTSGLLVKALGRALKHVIDLIVPQTMSLLTEAVKNGMQKKVDAMFEDTFVEASIDKFEGWADQIKNYAAEAEAKIDQVKEDFVKDFKWVDEIVDAATGFADIIKAGRVLLKCRKPPFLGCLGIFRDEANDHELNCVLCIPWVQKQVASIVMGVPWFGNMPAELATVILKTLHDAVPEKADILRDVFSEKITNQAPDVEDLMPDCDVKCDGFIGFESGGPGGTEVKEGDAETAKKIAELSEKMTKEQIEEMMHEAERRDMIDKPFDQKQAEELLKELEENRKKRQEEGAKPEEEGKKSRGDEGQERKSEEAEKQGTDKPPEKPAAPPQPPRKETESPPAAKKPPKKKTPKKQQPRKPDDWNPKGRNAPEEGKSKSEGDGGDNFDCTWGTNDIRLWGYVLEQGGYESLATAGRDGASELRFPKDPVEAECIAKFEIKNDFGFSPCERNKFSVPTVTTEVLFNGKQIFKQTDKKPTVHSQYHIEPTWGSRFAIPPLTSDGELQIKLTLFDPDTGTTMTFDDKVKIKILTKGLCCNCIS